MKKMFLAAALAIAALACLQAIPAQGKEKEDPRLRAAVLKAVDEGNLTVSWSYARSQNGSTADCSGYIFTLKDGKAKTTLPFFGIGDVNSAYGSEGDRSIIFEDYPVQNYSVDKSKLEKRSKLFIHFRAKSGVSTCDVDITIFTNGSVSMTVHPGSRSTMYYEGNLTELYY